MVQLFVVIHRSLITCGTDMCVVARYAHASFAGRGPGDYLHWEGTICTSAKCPGGQSARGETLHSDTGTIDELSGGLVSRSQGRGYHRLSQTPPSSRPSPTRTIDELSGGARQGRPRGRASLRGGVMGSLVLKPPPLSDSTLFTPLAV